MRIVSAELSHKGSAEMRIFMEKARKVDRRTVYTKNAVKDSVLELMKTTPFDRLSVAAVCKQAEITRSTFYSHYENLTQVLDELLLDALLLAENSSHGNILDLFKISDLTDHANGVEFIRSHESSLPPCQRVSDHEKYRVLFKDESIAFYITKMLFCHEKDVAVSSIMRYTGLPEDESMLLFLLILNGSYALNNYLGWKKEEIWYRMQHKILIFLKGGYEALKKIT